MKSWFVAKTKPRSEMQLATWYAQRGVEAYLPLIAAPRSRSHVKRALEPLFPGYLFSRLALGTSEWMMARSAPGVSYFLGAPGVPSALPDELVEAIRARAEGSQREGWRAPFRRNDRVVIERGPLAGLEAIFDGSLSARGRVRILIHMIHRLVPLELDVAFLARAG